MGIASKNLVAAKKAAKASGVNPQTVTSKNMNTASTAPTTSIKPAYNAATGATTGTPSAEYTNYLKSLNKSGSANYRPIDETETPTTPEVAGTTPISETPTTSTSPTLDDTQVQNLGTQGFMEGANVPGKGTLMPDGTFKQPTVAGVTGTDMSQTYRDVAANQPTGIDVSDPATARNQVSTAVQGATGTPPPTGGTEIMELFDTDQNKDLLNIEKMYKDFYSPKVQKDSLMSTYKEMVSALGINDINEELIDAKNIIEGTEDDIRTEITKAGGFATESQVQGMTNARNKSLIKNYNTLLETKNALTDQLGSMMQYAQADRTYAAQQFESRMNFEMKKIEYGQQAQQYANAQLGKIVDKVGYAGLLQMAGGDAYTTAKIEQALGLGQGGLTELASMPDPDAEANALDMQYKKAQIAKIYSDMTPDSIGGVPEKIMTKVQSSPEYKTINGVLPALQALTDYKNAINKYGTTEVMSGEGSGTLSGTYGNAIAAWKTLAGLGALSGADFELAENAVPSTGLFKRSSTSLAKLNASIDNAITQASNLTTRMSQNYPQAADVLEQQLDSMKVIAYPDKFKVGEDGLVYEITK